MFGRSSRTEAPRLYTLNLQAETRQATLSRHERDLTKRIAELEKMLAKKQVKPGRTASAPVAKAKSSRAAIVPADEAPRREPKPRAAAKAGPNRRRLTKLEQRELARERRRHMLISLVLVALLIGMVNWLAQLLQA